MDRVGETWPDQARVPFAAPSRPGQLDATLASDHGGNLIGVFVAYLGLEGKRRSDCPPGGSAAASIPQPMLIHLVPFLVAALFGSLASHNVPRLPVIRLVGALVLAAIAVGWTSRVSTGLVIDRVRDRRAAALLVSLAIVHRHLPGTTEIRRRW